MFVRRGLTKGLAAALAVAALGLTLGAAPLEASYSGAWDKRFTGCTCHSPGPSANVTFEVTGFPPAYELGVGYEIVVRLTGTDVVQAAPPLAGFNAEANVGTMAVPEGWQAWVQVSGAQATHTFNGTSRTDWRFRWVAPPTASGEAILWVLVNSVDGNGVPTSRDHWAALTLRSNGSAPTTWWGSGEGSFIPSGSAGLPVVVALAAAAPAAFFGWQWARKRRGTGERGKPSRRPRHPPSAARRRRNRERLKAARAERARARRPGRGRAR